MVGVERARHGVSVRIKGEAKGLRQGSVGAHDGEAVNEAKALANTLDGHFRVFVELELVPLGQRIGPVYELEELPELWFLVLEELPMVEVQAGGQGLSQGGCHEAHWRQGRIGSAP